jgi:hypothetical protein
VGAEVGADGEKTGRDVALQRLSGEKPTAIVEMNAIARGENGRVWLVAVQGQAGESWEPNLGCGEMGRN